MNKTWLIAAALALAAGPALAQEDHEAHHPQAQAAPASNPAQKPAARAQATDAEFERHMEKMQALMDRMRATKDPQERQKLMREHAQLMQEGMRMESTAMAQCPMMGEGGMDMMRMMMDHMHEREGMMGQGMMGDGMKGRGAMGSGAESR